MSISVKIASILLLSQPLFAIEKSDCLSNKTVQESLRHFASITDREPKLLTKSCQKQSYQISSDKQFIVYYNPKKEIRGELQNTNTNTKKSTKACLKKAEKDIASLNIPWSKKLLSKSKHYHDWRWSDPDIGPHTWLSCNNQTSYEYYSSLATFLHELNHDVAKSSCIYSAQTDKQICFHLDKELPLRGIAKADDFSSQQQDLHRRLRAVQDLYMNHVNKPPITLFGELSSFIVSSDIQARILKEKGSEIFIYRDYMRAPSMVPLFAFYTVNYLEKLKKLKPKLYHDNFVVHKKNRQSLSLLLAQAQKTHDQWQNTLSELDMPAYDYEKSYWEKFLKLRKGLDL